MLIQEIQRKFVCAYGAALEIQRLREALESIAEPMPNVGDWKSRAQIRQLRAFNALHPPAEEPGLVCITDPA